MERRRFMISRILTTFICPSVFKVVGVMQYAVCWAYRDRQRRQGPDVPSPPQCEPLKPAI